MQRKGVIVQKKISEIEVVPIKPRNGLVGFASIVFDNSFYFGSIGIYSRPSGSFRITYPTKGNGINVFHPINKEVAQQIEEKIVSRFEEISKK